MDKGNNSATARRFARWGSKRYINLTNVYAYLPSQSRFYILHAIQSLKENSICIATPLLYRPIYRVLCNSRFIFVTGVI